MPKLFLSKVEFYITNVCNLTCENCNRFNNYNFRGWQQWKEYENEYRRWADLIDLKACTIMGGEPLLNPTIVDWINGINDIFGIEVQVLTNGTRLNQVKGLYEAIAFNRPRNGHRNSIAISLHNPEEIDSLKREIHKFLKPPIFENTHDPLSWGTDYQCSDLGGTLINVWYQNKFEQSSIQKTPDGRFILHNSDPTQAHAACTFVKYKSYHFIAGKLYKCGPSALMPEFDQQHRFDISDEDRLLLHSYRPLTPDNFESYHKEFLTSLDTPIPQCKFCPVNKTLATIAPVRKGSMQ